MSPGKPPQLTELWPPRPYLQKEVRVMNDVSQPFSRPSDVHEQWTLKKPSPSIQNDMDHVYVWSVVAMTKIR